MTPLSYSQSFFSILHEVNEKIALVPNLLLRYGSEIFIEVKYKKAVYLLKSLLGNTKNI